MANIDWYKVIMTSNNSPAPYKVSASSAHDDIHGAWRAFDGVPDTVGSASAWATVSGKLENSWLKIDYGSLKKVSKAKLTSRGTSGKEQTPIAFRIEGSSDDINWTTMGLFENVVWGDGESKIFDVVSGYYRYIRVVNLKFKATNTLFAGWGAIEYGVCEKLLIKHNNNVYYFNETLNEWISLNKSIPTVEDFNTYGKLVIEKGLDIIPSPFTILGWTDSPSPQKFNIDGVRVEPFQLATLKSPIPIAWAERLKGILTTVQGNNGIKVALSFDNENWYGNGITPIILSRENVRDNGMTISELNGYNSTHLEQLRGLSSVLYLSYFFPDEASEVTEIKILGDEWGKYTQVEPLNVNYTVSYINPETLQVNINKNFDAIKINY